MGITSFFAPTTILATWSLDQLDQYFHATMQDATREQNAALLEALNSSGRLFLVHTDIGGELILRFALGSTQVQQQHVEAAWLEISQQADKLLSRGAA